MDGVEIRADGRGGHGLFATRRIAPGEAIAVIPSAIVLTLDAARASPLGVAAVAAGASDKMVMWMCMAHGREQAEHPWHTYLATLSSEQPGPVGWPEAALTALQSTPVVQMVSCIRAEVARELKAVLANIKVPEGECFLAALTPDNVLWARGLHLSRCFPAELGDGGQVSLPPDGARLAAASRDRVGCLLPLLDMLNHRPRQRVAWEAAPGRVFFTAGEEVCPGREIFGNYGCGKSNEETLFFYGFAESEPSLSYDVVTGHTLSCEVDAEDRAAVDELAARHARLASRRVPCSLAGADGNVLTLGPFRLDPAKETLLPGELLRALQVLTAEGEEQQAEQAAGSDGELQYSAEALGLLHASLRAALAAARAAPPPPAEPAGRAAAVRAYCGGRRRTLEAALAEVEELALLLEESGSEDEDDAEDGASTSFNAPLQTEG